MTAPYFSLSQGHLQLLSVCPPQFQRRYWEQLGGLLEPQRQVKTEWGQNFHQLVQQWTLGLPLETLAAQSLDPQDVSLLDSLKNLIATVPALHLPPGQRQAEHQRTLARDDVLLTVVYDLLVLTPEQGQIFDWKTYPQPAKPEKLHHHWQTKLYLYVLAETSSYSPEQLSMTYWFVQSPEKIQHYTITYNEAQHRATERELTDLLQQFRQGLAAWHRHRTPLAHRHNCNRCPYHDQFFPPD
ncbi:PD-(D/E)XK nuclease family protein [Synechocystis sp. CACIAM 05]|uniref:PD-(D/E)XK nuclease family protein n=1 Tax=Synechocystis sp. CACIAM 05 TaxID=1933929 RepID=UPI00138E724D|nr:PD-(D/E)XK nuclease family protein [Synechocystis sp. CACIAM 05]QHV00839.1 hypothetical protein BWK47_12345 [Synechocystis sp. CACIAM 05]